jgi:hypothetical protein
LQEGGVDGALHGEEFRRHSFQCGATLSEHVEILRAATLAAATLEREMVAWRERAGLDDRGASRGR